MAVIYTGALQQCLSVNTQEPKDGHRCVTVTERYAIIQNVYSYLCTHICMQQRANCDIINYNHERRYCQLTSETCLKIVEDPEFTVTDFSCLQWVSLTNVEDEMLVSCNTNYRWSVSRLERQSGFLVGTRYSTGNHMYVWENVTNWWSLGYNGDVLQILPWCSANWVSYVAGDPIPAGAAVGGYLGEDPSAETYIIRDSNDYRLKRCGYYDPDTKLGYVPHIEPDDLTDIDMLILWEE